MRLRNREAIALVVVTMTAAFLVLGLSSQVTASPSAQEGDLGGAQQLDALYEVRVNAGGGVYTDTDGLGKVWVADRAWVEGSWGYVGGSAYTTTLTWDIVGTTDDKLYRTTRIFPQIPGSYRFDDVPTGTYEIELRFAELRDADRAGYRLFDVDIQGTKYLCRMDAIGAVGKYSTYDWTFVVTVTNAPLTITFIPQLGVYNLKEAFVSAMRVTQLAGYSRPPQAAYPRIGVGISPFNGNANDYDVAAMHLGWYASWQVLANPPRPNGIEFVQLIDTRGFISTTFDWANLDRAISNNPGSTYLIGNEIEAGFQGAHTPQEYARIFNTFNTHIKGLDPTAKTAIGGVVMVSAARLRWLSDMLTSYQTQFSTTIPADVFTIHEQILGGDEINSWPVGIPAPNSTDLQREYHSWMCGAGGGPNDLAQFKNDVTLFRQWMKTKGLQNMPLWISEYGVLGGDEYGCTQRVIGVFVQQTMGWLNTAVSTTIGLPGDENRLVQRWLWYSMNDQPRDPVKNQGFAGAYCDYSCRNYPGALTGVGRAYLAWVNSITPPGPTPTPTETATPTITPTPTATRTPLPPGSGVLSGTVQMQGRGAAPAPAWVAPLAVRLFLPGDDLPAYQFDTTTDASGSFVVPGATTPGVWASSYNVKVKNPQMLQVVSNGLPFSDTEATVQDFGLLKGGDANNDNRVSLTDLSILASTYGKALGDPGYDGRADFSADGRVSLTDLSIMSSNYGAAGIASTLSASAQLSGAGLDAAPAARFHVSPANTGVPIGQQFVIDVYLSVSGQLGAFDFALQYATAFLRADSVSCTSPFTSTLVVVPCGAAAGTAAYAASGLNPAFANPGTYRLMRIVFRAMAITPSTPLSFVLPLDAVCSPTAGDCGGAASTGGAVIVTNPPTPTRTPTICPGCPTPTPTPTPPPLNLGVNVGGPVYTDSAGQPWQADKAYVAGSWGYVGWVDRYATSNAIANTIDDTLYQTERYGLGQYVFDVSPGTYSVTLKFAEIYFGTNVGGRVMNVKANGQTVILGLDVMKEVGRYAALDRTFLVNVTDYQLLLEFAATSGGAKVNAIRVAFVGGGPATATPTATATGAATATPSATATPPVTPTATPTPRDPYEPNDSFDQARAIQPGNAYLAYVDSASDADYYSFPVTDPTSLITVALTDLPADYDLWLHGPDRALLASSSHGGLAEEYILNFAANGQTGTYYVRVLGFERAYDANTPYRLRVDVQTPATPTRTPTNTATATATPTVTRTATATSTRTPLDPFEPNNTFEQATALTPGAPLLAYIDTVADIDYYKLTVPAAGRQIAVSLTQLPADYDLYLTDAARALVAWSRYGGLANEYIFYTAPSAGTYYLWVVGYNKAYDPAQSYRLLAQVN